MKKQKSPIKPTRLWQAFEAIPVLATVKAEWRLLLGDELPVVERLLQMQPHLATSYPRLERTGIELPLRVVDHGGGRFVGVCDETGESVRLCRDDLIVYGLDQRTFFENAAAAIQLSPSPVTAGKILMPLIVGYTSAADPQIPVVFNSPRDSAELYGSVTGWVSEHARQCVWLTPTRRFWTPRVEQAVHSSHCGLFALQELIDIDAAGNWMARPLARQVAGFGAASIDDEPLSERAQLVLIAMLEMEATTSDLRRTAEEITVKAFGTQADANALKGPMSDLTTRELTNSKTGRGGGYWLTEKGMARANRLRIT